MSWTKRGACYLADRVKLRADTGLDTLFAPSLRSHPPRPRRRARPNAPRGRAGYQGGEYGPTLSSKIRVRPVCDSTEVPDMHTRVPGCAPDEMLSRTSVAIEKCSPSIVIEPGSDGVGERCSIRVPQSRSPCHTGIEGAGIGDGVARTGARSASADATRSWLASP